MSLCGKIFFLYPVFFFLLWSSLSAQQYINQEMGYSLDLPAGWKLSSTSANQDIFIPGDSIGFIYISVVRRNWNMAEYASAETWTRQHFIAYLVTTNNGVDPWGAVHLFDSSQTSQIDGVWAPMAYSSFYSSDSVNNSWAEYIYYTCVRRSGFEIYSIGDTNVLSEQREIIWNTFSSIDFDESVLSVPAKPGVFLHDKMPYPLISGGGMRIYNVLGKSMPLSGGVFQNNGTGVYLLTDRNRKQSGTNILISPP